MSDNIIAGDWVGQDKIVVGNLTKSYAAIGTGAQLIINQTLSYAQELDDRQHLTERRLAAAIQYKINRYAELARQSPPDIVHSSINPYRSLLNYRIEDAYLFYGRDEPIQLLLRRMSKFRLTVLHAESGSGKTSLIEAGLASRLLADGYLPITVRSR